MNSNDTTFSQFDLLVLWTCPEYTQVLEMSLNTSTLYQYR